MQTQIHTHTHTAHRVIEVMCPARTVEKRKKWKRNDTKTKPKPKRDNDNDTDKEGHCKIEINIFITLSTAVLEGWGGGWLDNCIWQIQTVCERLMNYLCQYTAPRASHSLLFLLFFWFLNEIAKGIDFHFSSASASVSASTQLQLALWDVAPFRGTANDRRQSEIRVQHTLTHILTLTRTVGMQIFSDLKAITYIISAKLWG